MLDLLFGTTVRHEAQSQQLLDLCSTEFLQRQQNAFERKPPESTIDARWRLRDFEQHQRNLERAEQWRARLPFMREVL